MRDRAGAAGLPEADRPGDRPDDLRIASANPQKRRGVLLLNPGGPGLAGLDMPVQLVNRGIPAGVLDAYDLIGMDTRGVGRSAPVDCGFTVEQGYPGNVPPWAEDAATVTADARAAKSVAEQCAAHNTDGRMAHISTASTARDLDRIRAALGEKKASFFGLYNNTTYPMLAQFWQLLKASDETAAKRLMTTRGGLPAAGAQPLPSSNTFSAFLAVTCNDSEWGAQIYRKKFAKRSRLVTVDDNRHGVYVYGGNACALIIGTAWLVDGKRFKDTNCPAA